MLALLAGGLWIYAKLYSIGPIFRFDRPAAGRYRQFHQFDVEALGFAGPDVDAEHMVMLARLWKALGVADGITLAINSIGDAPERRAHRALLIAHFERHRALLDDDAQRRLHTNPLRILDSKNPAMQDVVAGAPLITDHLDAESKAHFDGLCAHLAACDVSLNLRWPTAREVSGPWLRALAAGTPDVAIVAVVPMPDPLMGERVCAYVQPAAGCTLKASGRATPAGAY